MYGTVAAAVVVVLGGCKPTYRLHAYIIHLIATYLYDCVVWKLILLKPLPVACWKHRHPTEGDSM